jgi:hypothetical protein
MSWSQRLVGRLSVTCVVFREVFADLIDFILTFEGWRFIFFFLCKKIIVYSFIPHSPMDHLIMTLVKKRVPIDSSICWTGYRDEERALGEKTITSDGRNDNGADAVAEAAAMGRRTGPAGTPEITSGKSNKLTLVKKRVPIDSSICWTGYRDEERALGEKTTKSDGRNNNGAEAAAMGRRIGPGTPEITSGKSNKLTLVKKRVPIDSSICWTGYRDEERALGEKTITSDGRNNNGADAVAEAAAMGRRTGPAGGATEDAIEKLRCALKKFEKFENKLLSDEL